MPPRPSPAASRRPRVPNPVLFKTLTASIVENLEQRYLLTAGGDTTDADLIAGWNSMSAAARHAIAVVEYINPDFQAAINADLAALGLDPIAPQPGAIPADPGKSKHHHRPRHHKINLFHKPKRHHRKTDPAPPNVTDVNYYYDQALPNQLAFTFDQDVTATSWNSALSLIDLNSGTTIAASGTYSPALHTLVFDLNASAALPTANYAAILHTGQITDTTHSLAVVGSDSVAGHDFQTSFFFANADLNRDRVVNLGDINIISAHFNTHPATFSQGDANFDSYVNIGDVNLVSQLYNSDLPLLSPVTAATAYVASSSSADIFWDTPSSTLVTAFDLYRNSTLLASNVTDTGYLDTGLSYNTTYNYFVVSKDTYGNTAFESPEAYVAIAPSTPTVSLSGDAAVTEGDTYFLGGAFANANNDEPTAWSVDWGDGSSATYTGFASAVLDSSDQIGGPANAFHTYSKGTYTLSASALSDIGTYPAGSLVVTVSDATPTFSVLGDQTFVQGQPYSINPTFTDFDPGLSWTVAWGDGSSNSTGTGTIPATLTHTFASGASAPFTLNAFVTTTDGTYTNSTTVDAAAPSLSITGSSSVQQGATYTLSRTFSDPAGLAPTAWSIDWGDGSSTTTAGSASTFTHTYSKLLSPGEPYTLAAYAVDSNGTYYAAPAQVTVNLTTPTLNLSAPAATVGNVVTVTNSSTSNGGDPISQWTIAWGDGSSSFATGSATAFTHAYTLPGTFTLSATASTAHGNYTRTLPVSVADHASFSITAPSGTAGASYLLGVNFTDPGSTETPSTYFVNWGDGSTSTYSNPTQYEGSFSHQYSTYGTQTLSVTATTSQGTYYQTAVASIAIPPLTLMPYAPQGNDAAENGEPYTLFVGPYGAQEPNYTVYWGDGQSSTDARWYTTHAYAYDPSPTANNQYVATLVCAGSTIGYCAPIVYDSGGDGTASISADSDTTDGLLYSVTGTFSDPNQTPPTHYSGPSAMYISWGDGEFDAGYDFEHTYSHAGTYNLEFDAIYQDDNSDPVSGRPVFDVITHKTVVVRPSTPAFDVFSTSGIHVDTTFSPTLYYDDSPYHDQTPQLWTIDWGDGQSASHWGPLPGTFSHAYHQKGPMVINATLTTDYGVYHSAASLTVIGPTIAVTGGGVSATEAEFSDPGFQISRGFATDKPLAVNFSLFGQATFGSDYQLLDPEGHILSSSIEIPAGQAFTDVIIHPVDDTVPEWTEPLTLSINPSPENAYAVSPTYNTATAEIVDNDLGITLGNGSGNIILEGSSDGRSNLVPLHITFPTDVKPGAILTLTDGAPTKADIWTSPSPAPGDQPLLGLVNGTYTSSVTWTYGVNTPSETDFWVGGTDGSTSFNEAFTLSATDAQATPAPTQPTETQANTPDAGTERLKMVELNNPNASSTGDWAGKTIPWLIGQMVALQADIEAPNIRNPQLAWTVQDQSLTGRYIDEPANSEHRKIVSLSNDDGGKFLPDGTTKVNSGLTKQLLVFFWFGTHDEAAGQSQPEIVTLSAPNTGLKSRSVTFNVFTPSFTATITDPHGSIALAKDSANNDVIKLVPPAPNSQSIEFNASVSTPQPPSGGTFHTGAFHFTQIIQNNNRADLQLQNGTVHYVPAYPTEYILDFTDPYGIIPDAQGKRQNGAGYDPFTIPFIGWNTDDGKTHKIPDAPNIPITQIVLTATLNQAFQTYLMYQPPGIKPPSMNSWDSQWVPLAYTAWSLKQSGQRKNNVPSLVGSPDVTIGTTFNATTIGPTWTVAPKGQQDFYKVQ